MFLIKFTVDGVSHEWVFDTYASASSAAFLIENRYNVQASIHGKNMETGSRNFTKAELMAGAAAFAYNTCLTA